MTREGIDISNYTSPLTDAQVQYIRDNNLFVIIGVQNKAKTLAFKEQLIGVDLEYYLDRPGRDYLHIATNGGERIWVDIEVGCYTRIADVDEELAVLQLAGYRPGIYCNRTSLGVLDGDPGMKWSGYPLWYADYRTPDLSTFRPFNGWERPLIWQYSSNGTQGINCDLNLSFEEAPQPAPPEPVRAPYVVYNKIGFSDGTEWYLEVKEPPL